MKKSALVLVSVLVSSVLMTTIVDAMTPIVDEGVSGDVCNILSSSDQKTVSYISSVLVKYAPKLDGMAGVAKFPRTSAKALRMHYMNQLASTIDSLMYEGCSREFTSAEDVMAGLREYIAGLKFIIKNKDAFTSLPNYEVANQGVESLQKLLVDTYMSLDTVNDTAANKNVFDLSFMADLPFLNFNGQFDLDMTSYNDIDNKKLATTLGFDGSLTVNEGFADGKPVSMNGYGNLDIRMIGKDMFLGMKNLVVTTNSQEEEIQASLKVLDVLKKVLGDKFVQITNADTEEMFNGFSPLELNQELVQQTLSGQPVLQFIYQQDGEYYGIINPVFCDLLPESAMMDCYLFNVQLLQATNMKGFFKLMAMQSAYYELSLSNKFVTDTSLTKDIEYMLNKPLMTWNASELTSISIPLDAKNMSKITYNNSILNVSIQDEEASVNVNGTVKKDFVDLDAHIVSYEDNMAVDMKLVVKPISLQKKSVVLKISVNQAAQKVFALDLVGTSENILFKDITVPTNVISSEELDVKMNEALTAEGL